MNIWIMLCAKNEINGDSVISGLVKDYVRLIGYLSTVHVMFFSFCAHTFSVWSCWKPSFVCLRFLIYLRDNWTFGPGNSFKNCRQLVNQIWQTCKGFLGIFYKTKRCLSDLVLKKLLSGWESKNFCPAKMS